MAREPRLPRHANREVLSLPPSSHHPPGCHALLALTLAVGGSNLECKTFQVVLGSAVADRASGLEV